MTSMSTAPPAHRRRLFSLQLLVVLLLPLVLPLAPAPAAAGDLSSVASAVAPSSGAAVGAPGLAVEGSDHAYLRIGEPAPPVVSYANVGYRLEVRRAEDGGTEAVIDVDLSPLGGGGPFVPVQKPEAAGAAEGTTSGKAAGDRATPGPVATLARSLTAGAGDRYQAVSAILGWMVHNVVSDETAALARSVGPPPDAGTGAEGGAGAAGTGPVQGTARPEPTAAGRGSGTAGDPAAATPSFEPVEVVLERGSGDAEEVARLAVALLQAVGIDARTVRGRVVGMPDIGSPRGAHVWIEVRYPERGWVFSDPLHFHHYVPATYVRFAPATATGSGGKAEAGAAAGGEGASRPDAGADDTAAGEAADRDATTAAPSTPGRSTTVPSGTGASTVATALRLVERRDRRETVDLYPAGAPGITARKADPAQQAGALRVVVAGGGRGSAVLEGNDRRTSKMLVGGESVFVGLEGGAYRLEVYLEGRPPIVQDLRVGERERRAVFLRDPESTAPEGPAPVAGRSGGRTAPPGPAGRGKPYP